ncbi:hypothetical protein Hanom_Chr08g00756111 [Helianthus anomalus]
MERWTVQLKMMIEFSPHPTIFKINSMLQFCTSFILQCSVTRTTPPSRFTSRRAKAPFIRCQFSPNFVHVKFITSVCLVSLVHFRPAPFFKVFGVL